MKPQLLPILERIETLLDRAKVFCATGPGGGIDSSCGRGGGGKAGIKKLTGDKKEGEALLSEIDAIDKTFGGKLGSFLEKNPIANLNVGTSSTMGSADGSYNPGTGRLTIKPLKKQGGYILFDEGENVTVDYANKFKGDTEGRAAHQKAAFTHELGHHVAFTLIKKVPQGQQEVYKKKIIDSFMKDDKKVSKYAETQPHEYFAESFAAYHLSPSKLSPVAKKMVEDVMNIAGGV